MVYTDMLQAPVTLQGMKRYQVLKSNDCKYLEVLKWKIAMTLH